MLGNRKSVSRQEIIKKKSTFSDKGIELRTPNIQKKEQEIKKNIDIPLPNIFFKDIVEEAVVHYANGNIKTATDSLVYRLNEKKGRVDESEWYMILDSYQSTNKKVNFEKLCSLFTHVFKLSPPMWQEYNLYKNNDHQELLNIDCDMNDISSERIDYMVENSIKLKSCCIDFSRTSINTDDSDSIIRNLAKKMEQIRLNKTIEVSLVGDSNIIQILKNKIENIPKEDITHAEKNKGYWLLLMEIYNWTEHLEEFEELSIAFSFLFRESPPTYTDLYKNNSKKENIGFSDNILPPQIIDNQNINELISQIKACVSKHIIKINFKEVIRINYQASITFAEFIKNFCENNPEKKIFILEPIEMIKYLFNMVGISHFVKLTTRKR